MTYRGHVKNGQIVLDAPAELAEGAVVRVELVAPEGQEALLDKHGRTLGEKLLKHAGTATGLPPDAARNHDHYLYGTGKR